MLLLLAMFPAESNTPQEETVSILFQDASMLCGLARTMAIRTQGLEMQWQHLHNNITPALKAVVWRPRLPHELNNKETHNCEHIRLAP